MNPGETPHAQRPQRFPLPPVVFVACLIFGYMAGSALPFGLEKPVPTALRAAGALCFGFGLMMIIWASSTLARAMTAILPHMGASALVTHGPFAWSRNPIYLGEAFILLGLFGLDGSFWMLAAAITFVNLVTLFGVMPEERHLAARFGPAWEDYAGKVRRWL